MLEKQVLIDEITIFPETGVMQIREKTRIIEDGKVISQSNTNRKVIAPDQPIDEFDEQIRQIAEKVRTPEKIAAYKALRKDRRKIK